MNIGSCRGRLIDVATFDALSGTSFATWCGEIAATSRFGAGLTRSLEEAHLILRKFLIGYRDLMEGV
jgi:hypothetical protein